MTINEFNETRFSCGMFAIYEGNRYQIVSVEFDEALIALSGVVSGSDDPYWVRCENVELVK